MEMRPVDMQSVISGIKETEKVQRSQEVRRQQQAHDFKVEMRRKEREDPSRVQGVARNELGRVEERRGGGEGGRRREEKGKGMKGTGKRGEKGGAVYNGLGRVHNLDDPEGPHEIVV